MEVWIELKPFYGVDVAAKALKYLGYADSIDIPDQPVGLAYSSPVVAAFLAAHIGGDRIVAHLRTVDMASNAVKSILKTLASLGVSRVVLLRGDPLGGQLGLPPEESLKIARRYKDRFGLKAGLIVSLRRSLDEIRARISASPDFILVLNAGPGSLGKLERLRSEFKGGIYTYLIVEPGSGEGGDARITSLMMGEDRLYELARDISERGLSDGFIVSSPGSDAAIERLSRRVKRL